MSSASLPKIGDVIAGKYAIERKLGEGGMGAVFAARNTGINKVFALKVMLPESSSEEAVKRFQNEATNAAGLDSDNVVRVFDYGVENGLHYMVLELLDGQDLAQIGEEASRVGKRLEPHVCVGWVLQALRGLAQAHAAGIIHRDLKPSNLFLAKKSDGTEIIKVLDFGISKAQHGGLGAAPSALTSTKAMLGSPLYVAPEQVRSSKAVDQRADIWAVGVILYELLTAAPPFMGEHLGELFAQIIEEKPIPITQRAPGVSPQLEAIVMRCLEKRPEARYQSVQELMSALQAFSQPMLMGTMAMSGPSPYAASMAQAPTAPPPHMAQTPTGPAPIPPGFAQTPSGSGPSPAMAITGSGVHPPVVKQPEWQSTTGGSGVPGAKKSMLFPVGIAVAVALLVVGGGLVGGSVYLKRKTEATPAGSAPPPVESVAHDPVTPPPSATPSAGTAAVGSATPPTASSAATASPPPTQVAGKPTHGTRPADPKPAETKPVVAERPPEPPPPAPVVKPPPPPGPKPTAGGGVVEEIR